MLRLPHRVSLAKETAATLKEWISAGVLGNVLPGEMQLKARLGVGRDTLRQSLRILEHEQWITTSAQGKQRKLLRPATKAGSGDAYKLPVTFLSPQSVVDRIILLELDDVQKRLSEQGRAMQFLSPNIFRLKHPEHHLEQLIRSNPSSAWILYLVGEKILRWFERQGIPAFIYGTPTPDTRLPFVVNDWEAAAFHAGVQLIRHGHRVIGCLRFENPTPGNLLVIRGLERALATIQPHGSLASFADDSTPQSVVRCLETAFAASPRPTAMVFYSSSGLLTCLSWMISKGIAAPRDVSLVSIPSDSWYKELCPPICHYQNNPTVFAHLVGQRVMELVETGEVTSKSVRVRLEYQKGATIGPPPRL